MSDNGASTSFNIGDRVSFSIKGLYEVSGSGEIAGFAEDNFIVTYIIILDEPLRVPGYDIPWKAIVVPSVCAQMIKETS